MYKSVLNRVQQSLKAIELECTYQTQIEDDKPLLFIHVVMEAFILLRKIDKRVYRIIPSHSVQLNTDKGRLDTDMDIGNEYH